MAHSIAALVRALAAGEQFERVAEVINARAEKIGLPAWFVARLKTDSYLESTTTTAS